MVNWAGAWSGFENRESESLGFESSAIRMSYNADSIIKQNRMELVPKLLPFVSIKWALEKMGLTMGEITACDESLRKEFIKKISNPNREITEDDQETLKVIMKLEGEPDRRAGPLC